MSVEVAAGELVRPWWRRARIWTVLATVVVLSALLLASFAEQPGRPLDPTSARKNGSQALTRLLDHYGARVDVTDQVSSVGPGQVVVIVEPDDYSDDQLRRLARAAARVVLVAPGVRSVDVVLPGAEPHANGRASQRAQCADAGAGAAEPVAIADDARTYLAGGSGASACFGGAVLLAPRVAVLGWPGLLQNDHLDEAGTAALAINSITDSRRLRSVVWLLPGSDAAGPGSESVWNLFPDGTHRVFWWVLAVGALLLLWRVRRLGGVIQEPLPVVVRASEVVEGHGRLYARAGARDRAAGALRRACVVRMGQRLGLPRDATTDQIAVAAANAIGRAPAQVAALLAGPPPPDDTSMATLAQDLDRLEAALRGRDEGTATE